MGARRVVTGDTAAVALLDCGFLGRCLGRAAVFPWKHGASAGTSASVNTVFPGSDDDRERPVHAACELSRDREPEAGARRLAARRAVEALEHALQLVGGIPGPSSRDRQASRGRRAVSVRTSTRVPAGVWRERVLDQIAPDLQHAPCRRSRHAGVRRHRARADVAHAPRATRTRPIDRAAASARSTSRFTNLIWPASSRERSSRSVASRVRRSPARASSRGTPAASSSSSSSSAISSRNPPSEKSGVRSSWEALAMNSRRARSRCGEPQPHPVERRAPARRSRRAPPSRPAPSKSPAAIRSAALLEHAQAPGQAVRRGVGRAQPRAASATSAGDDQRGADQRARSRAHP